MYNAYALDPGPSRELLAVHTPLGLIEPTRMVSGEMNVLIQGPRCYENESRN